MTTSLEKTIKGIAPENLLEQVPAEKIIRPKGFYKLIGLDVLAVLSAIWVGYACKNFLENGAVLDFAISIFPFLILASFESILIKNLWRRFLILALETILLLSFFYQDSKIYLLAAGGAFLIFSLLGEISSRSETLNSLEINFLKFSAPAFKKTITGLILFTIIIYVPKWNDKNVFISPATFGGVFVWVTAFMHDFYPEINFNSTVDDLAKEITLYQLKGSPAYQSLPEAAQQSLLKISLPDMSSRLKHILGENLSGNEEISAVTYNIILKSLNRWRADFGTWFVVAWIAAVFLTSRTIGAFIWWIAALISLFIYSLLTAIGFVTIRGDTVTKETLTFP